MNKAELRNYRALTAEVKQLESRLRALESSLSSPNGQRFTRTPQGPNDADKTMDALVEAHQDLVGIYTEKLLEMEKELRRIEEALDRVTDPRERLLLRYRYVEGLDWNRIAQEMHYSYAQTQRIHGNALLHVRDLPDPWEPKDCSGMLDE